MRTPGAVEVMVGSSINEAAIVRGISESNELYTEF